jgi:pyruvate/2-oxoglutarate/acetoin dehydrogenase E1 component
VAAPDAPMPFARPLELAYIPTVDRVVDAIRTTVNA